jgi:hypothetical protein
VTAEPVTVPYEFGTFSQIRSYSTCPVLRGTRMLGRPHTSTAVLVRPCSLRYLAAVLTFRLQG